MLFRVLFSSVILSAVYAHADAQEKQLIGICVEECNNLASVRALGIGGCAVGYECRSNGCGHTCQKVSDLSENIIGLCAELCFDGCQEGYECLSNGCGHSCRPVAVVS